MAIFLIILMAIAMMHFIYDGILLPSIRQHNRNKLFELRDRLRNDALNGLNKNDLEAFNMLHDGINNLVNKLPMLTVSVYVEIEMASKNDAKFNERIEKRRAVMENCSSDEIKAVRDEINEILIKSLIANTGGWMIYMIPIALVFGFWKRLINDCKKLLAIPNNEINRIIPDSDRYVSCM